MWLYLTVTLWLRQHVDRLRTQARKEDGYSTEAVIATAVLAGLALLVLGTIIWNAVVDKAESIDLG